MTRSDLIKALAGEKGISIAVADRIVTEIFAGMAESLIADDRIEIRGFGSFENRQYVGHTGRNPNTGHEVIVKPKKNPFFKTGKILKGRIMGSSL